MGRGRYRDRAECASHPVPRTGKERDRLARPAATAGSQSAGDCGLTPRSLPLTLRTPNGQTCALTFDQSYALHELETQSRLRC
jgi:hypothetical protein